MKLFIFPPAFGLRNVSPFCLKTEMALKYLNIDFELAILDDPRKAPKGKLPYLELDNGDLLPDSELIFTYLEKVSHGALYKDLSPSQMALGRAFTRLNEQHLYWLLVASRWLDDDWFPNVREGFFGRLPGPMAYIVGSMAQKQVSKTYAMLGLGDHTLDEQKAFASQDLQAINAVVSESNYLLGEHLSAFDFGVAALIAGIVDQKPATWMNELIQPMPALAAYAERVQKALGTYGREV